MENICGNFYKDSKLAPLRGDSELAELVVER